MKCTIIPYVLSLESELRKIHYYSYAEHIPEDDLLREITDMEPPFTIRFKILKQDSQSTLWRTRSTTLSYSDTISAFAEGESLELVYRKRIAPFGTITLQVREEKDRLTMCPNGLYYRLFKLRVENVIPPGVHLRDWTYVWLIERGFLSLHAATIAPDPKRACILMAPPNVGKSLTTLKALNEGWYFLSEDMSVVDAKGTVYAVPYTSTFLHERSWLRHLPLLSYYVPTRSRSLGELFKERLLPKANVRYMFFLEASKGEDEVIPLDKDRDIASVLNRMTVINNSEFTWQGNALINARFYLKGNLGNVMKQDLRLKKALLKNTKDVLLVRARSPTAFFDLIKEIA